MAKYVQPSLIQFFSFEGFKKKFLHKQSGPFKDSLFNVERLFENGFEQVI